MPSSDTIFNFSQKHTEHANNLNILEVDSIMEVIGNYTVSRFSTLTL